MSIYDLIDFTRPTRKPLKNVLIWERIDLTRPQNSVVVAVESAHSLRGNFAQAADKIFKIIAIFAVVFGLMCRGW